jgi:hypothetical protein
MWTDVSEERITSIFKVENQPSKKPSCSRWWWKIEVIRSSETSVHIQTARRYTPEYGNIHNFSCENLKAFINVFSVQRSQPLVLIPRRNCRSILSHYYLLEQSQLCYSLCLGLRISFSFRVSTKPLYEICHHSHSTPLWTSHLIFSFYLPNDIWVKVPT